MALFLFMGTTTTVLHAQSLIVRLNDGTEASQLLSTVQKLSFSQDELIVSFFSGSTDLYPLSDVRKLYFDSGTSLGEHPTVRANKLFVYPNPAGEYIHIEGIPDQAEQVFIYSSDGQLKKVLSITNDEMSVDISSLPAGLYLINAHGSLSRFIKK